VGQLHRLGEDNALLYEVEILKCLGAKQCDEIDDSEMTKLCKYKVPKGDATPGTLNRHLYTPVVACLRMALKQKAPMLKRPKGHNEVKPVETAAAEWFQTLWPKLNRDQKELVMFLACHGRRIGEARARRPKVEVIQADVLVKATQGSRTIGRTPGRC